MTSPSLRLRLLNVAMRRVVKPRLRKTGTPERARRDFERYAPFLFSKPRGLTSDIVGGMTRFTVGAAHPERAILYVHGGAFVSGSARSYAAMAGRLAGRTGAQVFVPEYPLLQDDPFPAAPTAILAAWSTLLEAGWHPAQIVIAADSAGGNLAFALLAQVLAVKQRPAAVVAFSPWTDLTLSGETIVTNADADALLPVSRMQEVVDLYLDGADAMDPRASPVFADFLNPPPVLIQVGAQEVLLSDSKRIADKLGAQITVWDNCPHVWQIFDGRLPEANAAMREVAGFVQTSFAKANL